MSHPAADLKSVHLVEQQKVACNCEFVQQLVMCSLVYFNRLFYKIKPHSFAINDVLMKASPGGIGPTSGLGMRG